MPIHFVLGAKDAGAAVAAAVATVGAVTAAALSATLSPSSLFFLSVASAAALALSFAS